MNDETWEDRLEAIEEAYPMALEGWTSENWKDFIRKELQRTRLETIAECEGVMPLQEPAMLNENDTERAWRLGRNEFRAETLKNLADLKNQA